MEKQVDEARSSLDGRDVKLRIGDLPAALGDATLVGRVLQNLLGNATRFHQDGARPEIRISADHYAPGWIVYSVSDNGIGIEPQYRESIFEPCTRLHTRSEYTGAGFGLSLCRRIVELHGGSMWIGEPDGPGRTVLFTMRAAEGAKAWNPSDSSC